MAKFKRASADEAQSKRKEFLKSTASGSAMIKGFKAPPSWDKDTRSARFVMTSESVDRYNDIVVQAGIGIDNFLKNPTALMFHNSRDWPIGNWSDITKILSGRPKRTEGTLNFLPEGVDEDADRAARHVSVGSIRTVSIGFIPDWNDVDFILDEDEDWTGGFRFNKSELIECSLVPIPAQPDALVKDAGGDFKLARHLIEDILDTYTKTPEGLLIPLDEYRAKHMDLIGNRTSIVVDKDFLREVKSFVPKGDCKLTASTDKEADAYVGARVIADPNHPENKEYPFSDVLARATGEIVASFIVDHGEHKGVHGLWVEFLTDDYSGMFRGIKADRFLLVKSEEPDDNDDPMEDGGCEPKSSDEDQSDGCEPDMPEEDGCKPKSVVSSLKVDLDLDTEPAKNAVKELSAEIDEVGVKAEGLVSKLKALFGLTEAKQVERIEPKLTEETETRAPPPSDEDIAKARSEARKQLAHIHAKGMV